MELPGNEIHLYFSYTDHISDPRLLDRYQSLLSDDERAQMPRFYFARHRHQFLLTRALIRTTLSRYFPVEPEAWRFDKSAYGKPGISSPHGSWPVRFNLSHCDGLILCGITRDYDIGVDVEDAQRSTHAAFESLSSYFSASEIDALARLPEDQQKQRFFDYWTLKESYIKARGKGLAIPLDKFSFQFEANRLSGFETHPNLDDDAANWQFWRMPVAERYQVAVAVNSGDVNFKLHVFNTVPLESNKQINPYCFV